jgi:hypothetical protein
MVWRNDSSLSLPVFQDSSTSVADRCRDSALMSRRSPFEKGVGGVGDISRRERLQGMADRDGTERLPLGGQFQDAAHDVSGENCRADPATADSLDSQGDEQSLHSRADGHGEHRGFGRLPARVGIAVGAVGNTEGDDDLGGVEENVPPRHP